MRTCEITPKNVWREYNKGVNYKQSIDLYDTIEKNQNFYNDKQWEGVNAPDLEKPVFNFLKPVVNYYIAQLVSDDIAARFSIQSTDCKDNILVEEILKSKVDEAIEHTRMKSKNRQALKDCAIDGDTCYYVYFDDSDDSRTLENEVKGQIKLEQVDNTNVFFGNPSTSDVECQPYILIAYRRLVEDVKFEAEENGENADEIKADDESWYNMNSERDTDNSYCTVILKLWRDRKTKTIKMVKTTQNAFVKREVDLGYKHYPITYMSWEKVKNSYHGVSPLTGKIANQIFVNKMYAMIMHFSKTQTFPKILYDMTKMPQGWSNKVGQAIGVAGNPNDAIFSSFQPAGLNTISYDITNSVISQTKDLMGASDVALGNTKLDNTSAIIAIQKAAATPLELQKQDFYHFIEETVRVFIEIMRVNYGVRRYSVVINEETITGEYDFSELSQYILNINVDIGQAAYWSELTTLNTLDAMYAQHIIPDASSYLERLPDGIIKNKQGLINKINSLQGNLQQQQILQEMPEQEMPEQETQGIPYQETPEQAVSDPAMTDLLDSEAETMVTKGESVQTIPEMSNAELELLINEIMSLPEERRETAVMRLDVSEESKVKILAIIQMRGEK